MLDYKDILTKHYALHLSSREISRKCNVSESGINTFLEKFRAYEDLDYPFRLGINNAWIAKLVYAKNSAIGALNESYEYPNYGEVLNLTRDHKNITQQKCWERCHLKRCEAESKQAYQ